MWHDVCRLQAMRIKHGIRFKLMAAGLRMAGHKKVADMIKSSWKVSSQLACKCVLQLEPEIPDEQLNVHMQSWERGPWLICLLCWAAGVEALQYQDNGLPSLLLLPQHDGAAG